MRRSNVVYVSGIAAVLVAGLGVWLPLEDADARGRPAPPTYRVDPFWPKPLPDAWVLGEVAGTCIDSRDHVFTVNRGSSPGGLIAPETVSATASPAIVEFDPEGNVVNAWENLAVMPAGLHGCFVDYQDNIWIAGNGDGIVQKWSRDGTLLMQIGTRGVCDTSTGACGATDTTLTPPRIALNGSHTLLNQPADVAVDPANGDIYVADGYGNTRIVVFDKDGNYLRQVGEPGRGPGQFSPTGGGHPHCVVLRDDEVYACDRANDRIQVFDKSLTQLKRIIPVVPGTGFGGR
ncbi:MAG TPA: 6-bladed beta-propeller, partial [Anaeromyxobacteraceae bacterium]|nr:6-bladed beta-propeller [Anaeromyxobacteraceae bacterium]